MFLPTRLFTPPSALESLTLQLGGDAGSTTVRLLLRDGMGEHPIDCGTDDWRRAATPVSTGYPEPICARARAAGRNRLAIAVAFVEAGFRLDFGFDLGRGVVRIGLPVNPGLDGRTVFGKAWRPSRPEAPSE